MFTALEDSGAQAQDPASGRGLGNFLQIWTWLGRPGLWAARGKWLCTFDNISDFVHFLKHYKMRMIWFKHLILKGLRTVGLMIVHSVHLNTFVLRNLVSFKIPFTDGVVSRDHRSSAQLHLHSGQLSINFDLKLLNSWESFTLLLFNHSTPNIYLFYYSSLERSHLPAKTRKIGHKILWI